MYAFQYKVSRRSLTPFVFPASEGCLESGGSRTNISNAALPDGDDNYVDFTSYSDGTDPYHPHSDTKRSISSPSGTPLSSAAASLRNAFRREKVSASLRAQEWVWAQRFDSPPKVSPLRPGVTFEETPIVHIVPPPLSEEFTDESEIVPPSPSGVCTDEFDEVPTMEIAFPSPLEMCTVPPDSHFEPRP